MTAAVIETDGRAIVLDLSTGATLFDQPVACLDVGALSALIDRKMGEACTRFAFGRWAEPRELYTTDAFSSDSSEMRTIHMGIDVFCAAGTPVCTPLDGVIEYVANNDNELDYGPVVIVCHETSDTNFYTLYGHLSLDTLDRVAVGDSVSAGKQIAAVGEPPSNGNWPPHLHFQQITNLLALGVDFPGVALKSEQDHWLALSPSPAKFFPECDPSKLEYRKCN